MLYIEIFFLNGLKVKYLRLVKFGVFEIVVVVFEVFVLVSKRSSRYFKSFSVNFMNM